MTESDHKMLCPQCREEMNHHADKLLYVDAPEAAPAGEYIYIEEFYTCPDCGVAASRHA
jgi:predicted RNA-binding Zn-ribbon protein involved in translation (DUF1610 family)